MAEKRIVVVGAGIAGLTAAYFLKQGGLNPIVLEKADRAGGRMMTDVFNGFAIDTGAQFLKSGHEILNDLINKLGLRSEYIETSQYVGTVRKGKIRKVNAEDPLSPLRAGLLSVPGWLRLGFLSYRLAARIKSLPANDITAWSEYDDLDGDTWSNSYFGQEVTDYIMAPPMEALFYQSLKDTSRIVPMSTILASLYKKSKFSILIGGINILPARLASQLNVRLNCPARSMSVGKSGIELQAGNERIIADRVILATTSSVSRVLYKEPEVFERELLATPYSSTIVIALAVKDSFRIPPEIGEIYGVFIPRGERNVIAAIGNEGNKDKHRLANGKLFTIFLSGKAGSEMMDWKEEDILPVVLKEMEKYYEGISGNILFMKMYRWKEAMPMTPPGRGKKVAQYRASINNSTRVFLAGDYMGMPFTEGAAESGRWVADALMKNIG